MYCYSGEGLYGIITVHIFTIAFDFNSNNNGPQ